MRFTLPTLLHDKLSHSLDLISVSISSLIGSSAGVIWHDALAVDMTAVSRNAVGILAFANSNRIAAVNAVAAFPRLFLLCRLSIIKPTSDAFSSSLTTFTSSLRCLIHSAYSLV